MKSTMPLSNSSVTQIAQVISQVTAPAFLLGTVAAFTSVLISRMNRIASDTDRMLMYGPAARRKRFSSICWMWVLHQCWDGRPHFPQVAA
jgi:hypothetical protein